MIEDMDQKALERFPELNRLAAELLAICDRMISERPTSERGDNLRYMAYFFFYKQITHLRSLLTLGWSQDTVLIARSMLEGWTMLLAGCEQAGFAEKWRFFYTVENWQRLQKERSAQRTVDPAIAQAVEEQFKERQHLYKLPEPDIQTEAKKHRKWLKNPYQKELLISGIADLFQKAGHGYVYDAVYREFCGWHHWNTRSIMGAARVRPSPGGADVLTFRPECPPRAARALWTGIMCLLYNAKVVNHLFKLDVFDELHSLQNQWVSVSPGYRSQDSSDR